MSQPLVYAHAGFSGTVPNSLSSIAEAGRIGANGIEIDLQCSADGFPVLAHDSLMIGRDGKKRRIDTLTAETIASDSFRPPGHDEPPPSLNAALDACAKAGLSINLDVKDPRVFGAISETLERAKSRQVIMVTGCDIGTLEEYGRPVPNVSFLVNYPRTPGTFVLGTLKRSLDKIATMGAQGINVQHLLLSESLLEETRRRFLSVSTWTVSKSRDIERVCAFGVDSITTNEPADVFACLRS